MKKFILLGICVLVIFTACESIVCEKPYIRYETACCLDENDNLICDEDEKTVAKNQPERLDDGVPEEITGKTMEPEKELITLQCPDGTLVINTKDCPESVPELFKLELSPIKDSIRKVDYALFKMTVYNFQDSTQTYVVEAVDTDWLLSTRPLAVPVKLFVAPGSRNHISLVLQPYSDIGKGKHSVNLQVSSSSETGNIKADIVVS